MIKKSSLVIIVSVALWLTGCQGTMRNIPGHTRLEQPSGLIEVRILAKGIE